VKRVLFLIDDLNCGGAEKSLINLLRNLSSQKYFIDIFLIVNKGEYIKEVPSNVNIKTIINTNIKNKKIANIVIKIKLKLFRFYLYRFNNISSYKKLVKNIYDVEIAFLEGMSTKIIANSKNLKSIKIAWVHTDLSKNHWYEKVYKNNNEERNSYKRFNKIIAVSEDAKKGFKKILGNDFNLNTINNIIDSYDILRKSNEYKVTIDCFTICTVGNLKSVKGYERLIKVHAKLIKNGFYHKLIIIGEGSERLKLEKLISKLDVCNSIELKGQIENPYPYIKNSNLYVCSSFTEGFPLSVAEAIILEKPIVATKCTGTNELLGNGEYGIIIKNSEEGLYEGISRIINNQYLMHEYEAKTKKRAEMFDKLKIIEQLESVLD